MTVQNQMACGILCSQTESCIQATYFDIYMSGRNCFLGVNIGYVLVANVSGTVIRPKRPKVKQPVIYSDCKTQLEAVTSTDGVYMINPDGNITEVVCDLTTSDGGWTIFQQRRDGTVDFYRNWVNYTHGFGDITSNGNYWLGLDHIHHLTQTGTVELMVKLRTAGGIDDFAHYSSFSVDGADNNYDIHVSGYSVNAGDSLTYVNGAEFGTHDNPNLWSGCISNPTVLLRGAWWYKCGSYSNLNGEYLNTTATSAGKFGMRWYNGYGTNSMMESTMMLRRLN